MSKPNNEMHVPLRALISGPWGLLAVGLMSLGGLAWSILRRRHRRKTAPEPVSELVWQQVIGNWHEVAKIVPRTHLGCVMTGVRIDKHDEEHLHWKLECRIGSPDGPARKQKRKYRILSGDLAKWKPRGWGVLRSEKWVFAYDPDEEWMILAPPERTTMQLLARRTQLPGKVYENATRAVEALGFPIKKLTHTLQ